MELFFLFLSCFLLLSFMCCKARRNASANHLSAHQIQWCHSDAFLYGRQAEQQGELDTTDELKWCEDERDFKKKNDSMIEKKRTE